MKINNQSNKFNNEWNLNKQFLSPKPAPAANFRDYSSRLYAREKEGWAIKDYSARISLKAQDFSIHKHIWTITKLKPKTSRHPHVNGTHTSNKWDYVYVPLPLKCGPDPTCQHTPSIMHTRSLVHTGSLAPRHFFPAFLTCRLFSHPDLSTSHAHRSTHNYKGFSL